MGNDEQLYDSFHIEAMIKIISGIIIYCIDCMNHISA
jgi:hypothetical protein